MAATGQREVRWHARSGHITIVGLMTPLRRSRFSEGFQAILEKNEGFYLHLYLWSFDSTLAGTPSHPVCIEGLHSGDDTILRRCCAVAAITGDKQDKSLSSCILCYGWDAVDRERVAQKQEILRGSNTSHMNK